MNKDLLYNIGSIRQNRCQTYNALVKMLITPITDTPNRTTTSVYYPTFPVCCSENDSHEAMSKFFSWRSSLMMTVVAFNHGHLAPTTGSVTDEGRSSPLSDHLRIKNNNNIKTIHWHLSCSFIKENSPNVNLVFTRYVLACSWHYTKWH